MRDRILLCLSALLYYSGFMRMLIWLHQRAGRRLLIVNYHQAAGGELQHHLLYLRKYFRLQFVDQALAELYTDTRIAGNDRRLPLAVTFDDGYLDNYTHAYALARELQVPITIFLISGYIGNGTAYWWFDHLVEKSRVEQITIDDHTYCLNNLDEQQELACLIAKQLRSRVDEGERQAYLSKISNALAVPIAATAEAAMPMLSWEQVQEMQASGLVAFGGHTQHHATLSMLANAEETCQEVMTCHALMQQQLGQTQPVFAYPHGGIEHIGANGILAAQRAGYRWAVTTIQGVNTPQTHPYLIRRISANSQLHWLLIALMTSGLWDLLSYVHWTVKVKRMKYSKILQQADLPHSL